MAQYDEIEKVVDASVKRSKGGVSTKALWKQVKSRGLTEKYFDMLKVIRDMQSEGKVILKGQRVTKGSYVNA